MEESQATFSFNGVDLVVDFLDADTLEKFNEADDRMIKALNDPDQYKGLSQPEQMRRQCELTEKFFDEMFGEGTAEKVFEGRHSHLGDHVEAFRMIINAAQAAPARINKIMGLADDGNGNAVPKNRAQRRAEEHQKAPQPGKQTHYDNYKDRLAKAVPAATTAPEKHESDPMEEVLANEGITREQFEQAMEMLRNNGNQ